MQEYQYLTWVWELQNNNKKRKKKHIKTATFPFSFFLKLEIQLDYYREGQIMFLRQAESSQQLLQALGKPFAYFQKEFDISRITLPSNEYIKAGEQEIAAFSVWVRTKYKSTNWKKKNKQSNDCNLIFCFVYRFEKL